MQSECICERKKSQNIWSVAPTISGNSSFKDHSQLAKAKHLCDVYYFCCDGFLFCCPLVRTDTKSFRFEMSFFAELDNQLENKKIHNIGCWG